LKPAALLEFWPRIIRILTNQDRQVRVDPSYSLIAWWSAKSTDSAARYWCFPNSGAVPKAPCAVHVGHAVVQHRKLHGLADAEPASVIRSIRNAQPITLPEDSRLSLPGTILVTGTQINGFLFFKLQKGGCS
jgi:hypothetical protein